MQSFNISAPAILDTKNSLDVKLEITPEPLVFLRHHSQSEVKELQEKILNKPGSELDILLQNYVKSYYYYLTKIGIANASNLLFVIFQIKSSNEGITSFAQVLQPNLVVPNVAAYAIGIPCAVLDTMMYIVAVDYKKEAIKSTLNYIKKQESKTNRLQKIVAEPGQSAESLIHWSILTAVNATGATTLFVELSDSMRQKLPLSVYGITVALTLYTGIYYYKKYLNFNYFKGYEFWRDTKNIKGLFKPFCNGEVAASLQILLQGSSAIFLTTFPTFWYYATKAKEKLGWWLPVELIAACSVWRNLCVLFPESYHFYKDDEERTHALYLEKYSATPELMAAQKAAAEKTILAQQEYFYVFKQEKMNLLTVAYRTVCSGVLGLEAVSTFTSNPWLGALGTLVSASIGGGALYSAQKHHVNHKIIRAQTEIDFKIKTSPDPMSSWSKTVGLTYLLCITSGITTYMATMGSLRLLGFNSPTLTSVTAIVAGERMINNVYLNSSKVYKTLSGLFGGNAKPSTQPEEKTTSSWCCWRRSHS